MSYHPSPKDTEILSCQQHWLENHGEVGGTTLGFQLRERKKATMDGLNPVFKNQLSKHNNNARIIQYHSHNN